MTDRVSEIMERDGISFPGAVAKAAGITEVERLSWVLFRERFGDAPKAGDFVGSNEVVAVLEALREPSDAMLDAARNQSGVCTGSWDNDVEFYRDEWQAMIDAILNEGQE